MKQDLETLELKIARLLRYGVIAAGLMLLVGWFLQLHLFANPFTAFHEYKAIPLLQSLESMLHSPSQFFSYLGLFLLISLPLLRVLLTAVLFIHQGDRILSLLAVFVFVVLILSCVLGLEV